MKKSVYLIAFFSLIFLVSCNHIDKKSSRVFDIHKSYLLIPAQDNAPDKKVVIKYPDKTEKTIWVKLAQDHTDYLVKLDVSAYKGKTVTLFFENIDKHAPGEHNIEPSNSFKFNYNEKYRPVYHFTPPYGWMNDPNGMVYLDGEYHLFYQYNPYGNKWGNMHWGHAVSKDLVTWKYLPVALAPDTLGDIFSGSAVIDKNNTAGFGKNAMIAIYTANGKTQQECIAYSNDHGRTFTKYKNNPVIPNPGITDFRDPKVSWNPITKQWLMALATGQSITFYGSPDLKHWNKLSEFGKEIGSHAGVWECPDLFPLTYKGKIKWVLLVSINPGGPNGGSATQYFIGKFDGKTFEPDALPYPLWIDYGRDDYAGVTWSNIPSKDGRHIFLGWMSNWDYANDVPTKNFRSANTCPRELNLMNDGSHLVLASYPVEELNQLRSAPVKDENIDVTQKATINHLLSQNKGAYELDMNINPLDSKEFGFCLQNNDDEFLKFNFDLYDGFFSIDRSHSGLINFSNKFSLDANGPLPTSKSYMIRLLVDKASAEIFINKGELTMTTIFFPKAVMNQLEFYCNKNINVNNIYIYQLSKK